MPERENYAMNHARQRRGIYLLASPLLVVQVSERTSGVVRCVVVWRGRGCLVPTYVRRYRTKKEEEEERKSDRLRALIIRAGRGERRGADKKTSREKPFISFDEYLWV